MLTDDAVRVGDLPVVDKNVDAAELARIVVEQAPDVAVIERVGAFPKQGISSAFAFGRGYGTCIGVLGALRVPLFFVTPGVWKKHYSLSAKDKEGARALAVQRFPAVTGMHLRKHHGRAEALLLAAYFKETKRGTAKG